MSDQSPVTVQSDIWERAIADRLSELSQDMAIPIAALPKQASRFLSEQSELIDFFFTEKVAQSGLIGGIQCRETLTFRIYLSDRYATDPQEKTGVNFAVATLIKTFSGFNFVGGLTPLKFVRSRLFAPVGKSWYTELEFAFDSFLKD